MSSTAKRFYRLLSGYVGREWDRIRGVIDEYTAEDRLRAVEELDEATRTPAPTPTPSQPPPASAPPRPQVVSPLAQHYAVLGLEDGTDFALVRHTYLKYLRRTDPGQFQPGSEEATKAAEVRSRVEASYGELRKALDPSAKRFSDLEL